MTMNRIIFLILLLTPLRIWAQDVIVKKDGSTILAKILEVNPNNVKYKKHNNLQGPTYTINISDLLSINYPNGDRDDFSDRKTSESDALETSIPKYINKNGDNRNAEIIELYNRTYLPTSDIRNSSKDAKGYLLIFGVKRNSILSNDEVEMTLVRKETRPAGDLGSVFGEAYCHIIYNIVIKNKTDKVLYVDKGNCFCVWEDETALCFYNPTEQTTVSNGKGTGISLGLGAVAGIAGVGGALGQLASGVNLGGGKNRNVSTTYTQQRIVAIPPHSTQSITNEKCVLTHKTMANDHFQMIEKAESFDIGELSSLEWSRGSARIDAGGRHVSDFRLNRNIVKIGGKTEYNEENTPYTRKYIVTYSTDQTFSSYSSLKAELYLHQLIGCGKIRKGYFPGRYMTKDYIEGIDEYTIEGYYPLD